MTDADEARRESRESWGRAAAGWRRRQDFIREMGAPVAHWLVDALHLQPGHRVLELAAGTGETGFLAAELIEPGGKLICSDHARGMVDAARERAAELGLGNVEFRVIDAEWIDLPLASLDAVLCRWGYMLMSDPAAALRETRRVLRPGGRVALAVWGSVAENPWFAIPASELSTRGLVPAPQPGSPGPFALGDLARVVALLEDAGFTDVATDTIEVIHRHANLEEWWANTLDLSSVINEAVKDLDGAALADLKAALGERFAPYSEADGAIALPGRSLVAAAGA